MTPETTTPVLIIWTDGENPEPVGYTVSGQELIPIYEVEAADPQQETAATSEA